MKSKYLFALIILVMLFMLTTGIALPWVISNDALPVWLIVIIISGIVGLWYKLLEDPYKKLKKSVIKSYKKYLDC